MAADVSTLVRLLSRCDRGGEEGSPKTDLVTTDLLGGCCVVGSGAVSSPSPKKVPFPELHVLPGREKRLQTMDLNLPPLWTSAPLPPVRMTALENSAPTLDLRLRSLAPPPPLPAEYPSVCTLEKVKSALERAELEPRRRRRQNPPGQPRHAPTGSVSPTSSSTTTSSVKRRLVGGVGGVGAEEGEGDSGSPPGQRKWLGGAAADPVAEMAAAGCPRCLMYVLISRSNPRCPGCSSAVPLPPPPPQTAGKKARIDLNATTSSVPPLSSSPIRTLKFF